MKKKVNMFLMKNMKFVLALSIVALRWPPPCLGVVCQPQLSDETKLAMKKMKEGRKHR